MGYKLYVPQNMSVVQSQPWSVWNSQARGVVSGPRGSPPSFSLVTGGRKRTPLPTDPSRTWSTPGGRLGSPSHSSLESHPDPYVRGVKRVLGRDRFLRD